MNSETTQQIGSKAKKPRLKIAIYTTVVLGFIAIVSVIVLLLLPDIFVNKFLKDLAESEFRSAYPEYSLTIADLNINLLNSHVELGDVEIKSKDSTFTCRFNSTSVKGVGWWQLIWKGSGSKGALDESVAEVQSFEVKLHKELYRIHSKLLRLSFRDSLITLDSLEIIPMVDDSLFFDESEFQKKRIRMNVRQMRVNCFSFLEQLQGTIYHASSLQISDVSMNILVDKYKPEKPDTAKKYPIKKFLTSLKEIVQIDSFIIENTHIQYGESLTEGEEATEGYTIDCMGLYTSISDSDAVVNDLTIDPLMDENQYFDASKFGRTRIALKLPQIKLNGLSFPDLLQGDKYQARLIEVRDASAGIQVSKFKSKKHVKTKLPMPNEILAEIKQIIQIDSVSVVNGHLEYGEYYAPRSKPALIVFNNMNAAVLGISNNNNNGDTAIINFASEFMNGATLSVMVRTPLTSPTFSLQSSGTLSEIKLTKLNTFLETAEHVRIKSGVSQFAGFNLIVDNGKARGTVSIEYKDFSLAFIDQKSRSDKGIFNVIKSFLANTFQFNSESKRDKNGKLKLGKINYKRKPDDTFMQVLWYSVRSGVAETIGFPPIK